MRFKNLLGEKFGNVTIVEQLPDHYTSGGKKIHKWRGVCDCGRCDYVRGSTTDFTSGKIWRCMYCVRDDAAKRMSERNKKYNTYDLSREYGVGYTSKGEEFWFDLEDYDKIKDYCWYKHHQYFEAKIPNNKNDKHIALHKLIMDDIDNEYDIDHIKTEYKHDNRKLNLRKVNRRQNNQNAKLKKSNTSSVTGVYWHKRDEHWVASIRTKDKYYQKYFDTFDAAVAQRKQWENDFFGEYCYDNSQKLYKELSKTN